MDFTVFRQASKTRPDGTIIYKGEDAVPYVGNHILLVADGLGGAAAIRHQSFNKEMFDANKLFDILFNGVFDEYDQTLIDYVKSSFKEFLGIKECYFDNVNNIKKSGYFASRIVSAIFLYLAEKILKDETFLSQCNQIFNNELTSESSNEVLEKFSKFFVDNISSMLQKVSKNANLIYESAFTGLALLGTTLCATIYFEREDSVKALYFVAGDSRPYLWNETGLYQISADQKRADGGMTNYVKANGDFEIKCEYRSFAKPCVLFNASDGIFDSEKFSLSQLGLEKLLLDTIISSSTIQEVGAKLETGFLEWGNHDDSSTMAFKAFGYDSFESLQSTARMRDEKLMDGIFSKIPDILEHNYIDECSKKINYAAICENIWETWQGVADYFISKNMENYKLELTNIDAALHGCKNLFAWQREDALTILENYTNTNDADRIYLDILMKKQSVPEEVKKIYVIILMEEYKNSREKNSREDAENIYSKLLARGINLDKYSQLSSYEKIRIMNCVNVTIDGLATYSVKSNRRSEIIRKIQDEAKREWLEVCDYSGDVFTLIDYLKANTIVDDAFADEYIRSLGISRSSDNLGKLQKEIFEEYDRNFYGLIEVR